MKINSDILTINNNQPDHFNIKVSVEVDTFNNALYYAVNIEPGFCESRLPKRLAEMLELPDIKGAEKFTQKFTALYRAVQYANEVVYNYHTLDEKKKADYEAELEHLITEQEQRNEEPF